MLSVLHAYQLTVIFYEDTVLSDPYLLYYTSYGSLHWFPCVPNIICTLCAELNNRLNFFKFLLRLSQYVGF